MRGDVRSLPKVTGLVDHRAIIQIQAAWAPGTLPPVYIACVWFCFLRACLCNTHHEVGENSVLSSQCLEPFLFERLYADEQVISLNRLVFAATVDFPSTWTTPFTSTVLWHQPWGKLVLINVALGMKFLTKRAGWGRQNGKTGMREGEYLVLVCFVAEMVLVPSTTAETEMVLEYLFVQLIRGTYRLWQWWRS